MPPSSTYEPFDASAPSFTDSTISSFGSQSSMYSLQQKLNPQDLLGGSVDGVGTLGTSLWRKSLKRFIEDEDEEEDEEGEEEEGEEEVHPWNTSQQQGATLETPFLRLWDEHSGSQPKDNHMKARATRQRLNTRASRKESLSLHLKHDTRTPTPYISFTVSPSAIRGLAPRRTEKRGPQKLIVVDPIARKRNRMPFLHVLDEMDYYDIPDPYNQRNRYYRDHYICLWEVTPDEVVGQWDYDDLLSTSEDWYEDIILPAVENFRQKTTASDAEELANLLGGVSLANKPKALQSSSKPNKAVSVESAALNDHVSKKGAVLGSASEKASTRNATTGKARPKKATPKEPSSSETVSDKHKPKIKPVRLAFIEDE
ncbi:hypothetical protein EJ05DRAFT_463663 [Pseudovirgaria hyperparasitica]|uniref:DUF7587 domain-containing protein n=1 Tax=Pseudovirgaria hyperparasitica TaxID=470096 RepID=A0A6A6WAZ6_9PEZI|nr:uncharacterized protein EJ05DRAFT_463663 [Pseudovirgaria hyperparasitica]KAF2759006.1 hypothetical protein EJ05DRAFT_463663 [Pseudovirgaria hyperparasitica]